MVTPLSAQPSLKRFDRDHRFGIEEKELTEEAKHALDGMSEPDFRANFALLDEEARVAYAKNAKRPIAFVARFDFPTLEYTRKATRVREANGMIDPIELSQEATQALNKLSGGAFLEAMQSLTPLAQRAYFLATRPQLLQKADPRLSSGDGDALPLPDEPKAFVAALRGCSDGKAALSKERFVALLAAAMTFFDKGATLLRHVSEEERRAVLALGKA